MTTPAVCILSGEVANSDVHARFRALGADKARRHRRMHCDEASGTCLASHCGRSGRRIATVALAARTLTAARCFLRPNVRSS